jgi:hypothetical protein
MLFFPTAATDRGRTVIVTPCECLWPIFISFLSLGIHAYCCCHFTLFWWCELPYGRWCKLAQARVCMMMFPRVSSSSWGTQSTGVSTLSTDASSEPRAVVCLTECQHAEVGRNRWALGRMLTTSPAALEFLLPRLPGNTPSSVCWDDRPSWG